MYEIYEGIQYSIFDQKYEIKIEIFYDENKERPDKYTWGLFCFYLNENQFINYYKRKVITYFDCKIINKPEFKDWFYYQDIIDQCEYFMVWDEKFIYNKEELQNNDIGIDGYYEVGYIPESKCFWGFYIDKFNNSSNKIKVQKIELEYSESFSFN